MLVLYDDARARAFAPFALTRPLGEMRAGVELLRRRWEAAFDTRAAGAAAAPHLAQFDEADAPPAAADVLQAGTVLVNTRCAVPLGWRAQDVDVWTCADEVAAVRLARDTPLAALAGGETPLESLGALGARGQDIPGRWLTAVWSFVADLPRQLRDDIAVLGPRTASGTPPAAAIVIGDHPIYVAAGAVVEPAVCFDVSAGPVLVAAGATVRAFTRLVGPCAVGRGATILGSRVSGCSIGEGATIRGEISETVVLGHANKTHDGFVGHSYLGRWVNLGAGTITSNLKNTYGTVHLWTPAGRRDTGLVKLGTMFGDHVKTGIGTRLTTGSVIGAGSNIYGSHMPPHYVPPFSWGEGDALGIYRLEKFLETAERAMGRRGMPLSDRTRRQLAAAFALATGTAV
ncbi:MAG TPA: putative sugar nucleotidyl transferase [Gemmatimonadaceae bacterium]|jgi:UDP-N-acetylglucosamine diphosphorylase/glucosamine-1-phosphate N-acetyltransferase